MENWEENEVYKIILKYIEDKDKSIKLFSNILSYMIETYGEDNITLKNFTLIMPGKLYDIIDHYEVDYADYVYIMARYKAEYGITSGFPIKKYEDIYNVNKAHEDMILRKRQTRYEHQKKAKEKKREKQAIIIHQDFDEKLFITESNIIRYLKEQNPKIEFINPNDINTSYAKNLDGVRVGKLVYGHPYRDKSIKDMSIYWIGMCDCGNYRVVQSGRVHEHTSCGVCDEPEHLYIGQKFGSLTCIDQRYLLSGKHTKTLKLKCKCDCGNEIIIFPSQFGSESKQFCHKNCKYAIENRKISYANQGEHFKPMFFKGTNVGKIGRKETNSNSSTGYLGVYYNTNIRKYMAYITFQGKSENLGYYESAEEAYKVRLSAQNILHAKFLDELEDNEFIQQNTFLSRLLLKVKIKLQQNIIDMPK